MKRMTLTMLLAALTLPFVAQAQPGESWTAERWDQIMDQAVRNLDSEYPAIRQQGLKNVIYLAEKHPDKVSAHQTVRRVIRIYETDTNPDVQALALAALESIGNGRAKRYVRTRVLEDRMAQTRELITTVVNEQAAQMGRG